MNDVPTEFWIWGVATLLMAAATGFATGLNYERVSLRWSLRRSRNHASRAFRTVLKTLRSAQEACDLLSQFPQHQPTSKQIGELDKVREQLTKAVSAVVKQESDLADLAARQSARPPKKLKGKPASIDWVVTLPASTAASTASESATLDIRPDPTGLPGRACFETNLQLLLETARETEQECGVLLIKVDKADQLRQRFGTAAVEQFLRTMADAINRSTRDVDLVCRYTADTFAALIPAVPAPQGRKVAESIRDTIRHYKFRLNGSGPEVLVTASLGYSPCLPDDNTDLVVNRAGDALARSQRRGRNQLCVYENGTLVHCLVG